MKKAITNFKENILPKPEGEITVVLQAIQEGDPAAADRLLSLVYAELHELARARMAKLPVGQTLQPTALIHEAYLRLTGKEANWENRRHFFFAASRAMRDILVEQARRKAGPRLGGKLNRQELGEFAAVIEPPSIEVLGLNEALDELEKLDSTKAKIVQLRYFGGLTMAEIADVFGQSEITIHRHWRFTRAWLKQRIGNA